MHKTLTIFKKAGEKKIKKLHVTQITVLMKIQEILHRQTLLYR